MMTQIESYESTELRLVREENTRLRNKLELCDAAFRDVRTEINKLGGVNAGLSIAQVDAKRAALQAINNVIGY